MKKVLLISFLLFFFTTSFAGISTKKKDTLKLIGTSYALNGDFAWIELNGEDYGWTREGRPWNITHRDKNGNIIVKFVNGKQIKQ